MDDNLHRCLRQIEKELGWGNSHNWSNSDFEALSTLIIEKTKVKLSITTLKRVWGKVQYRSVPTLTTLNTLAQFAGYNNWRDFTQKSTSTYYPLENYPSVFTKFFGYKKLLILCVLICSIVFIALFIDGNTYHINPEDYFFTSTKIESEGVPNSVVFNFNATASPDDSVYIQQSWDKSRSTRVSKMNGNHTSIYYYPGYYNAKLVVANTIVKEHEIFITSNGWTAAIDKYPVPAYLNVKDFIRDSTIDVTADMLEALNIPMQPNVPQLRIHNVRQMKNLKNDNFVFKTSVRNRFSGGTGACQKIEILILCKNDIFIIPLSSKRCAGDLFLVAADKEVSSKETDLSGFGTNLSNWTNLRVECENKQLRFFINDTEAYSTAFTNAVTEIVGVQYRFQGLGSIKNTSFTDGIIHYAL